MKNKATPSTTSSKENSQNSEVTVQESIAIKVDDSTRTKQNTQESNIIKILEKNAPTKTTENNEVILKDPKLMKAGSILKPTEDDPLKTDEM